MSLLLLSLGTQGLILEIFVLPGLLIQVITFFILIDAWIHLCTVPRKYRRKDYRVDANM